MGRLQKRGDVFEAQILMNKMRSQGHRASVRTYTTLLATISKSRDPEARVALFRALERTDPTQPCHNARDMPPPTGFALPAIPPTRPGIYDSTILAQRLACERTLFTDMPNDGVTPDEPCYNAVLQVWCNAKQPERAQAVLERMKEAGVPPSHDTYGPLITAYGE
eukprot:8992778-Pyramimonas_sp.AAC.1